MLSLNFLRLPSKRQYPDYYQLIKRPVALDEIKGRLDVNAYTTLDEVHADFETCFRNAKRYNIRESQIWSDAKALQVSGVARTCHWARTCEGDRAHAIDSQRIAKDAFRAITNEGSDSEGSGDEGDGPKKKKKGLQSIYRTMKNRLQKLISKKDELWVEMRCFDMSILTCRLTLQWT